MVIDCFCSRMISGYQRLLEFCTGKCYIKVTDAYDRVRNASFHHGGILSNCFNRVLANIITFNQPSAIMRYKLLLGHDDFSTKGLIVDEVTSVIITQSIALRGDLIVALITLDAKVTLVLCNVLSIKISVKIYLVLLHASQSTFVS